MELFNQPGVSKRDTGSEARAEHSYVILRRELELWDEAMRERRTECVAPDWCARELFGLVLVVRGKASRSSQAVLPELSSARVRRRSGFDSRRCLKYRYGEWTKDPCRHGLCSLSSRGSRVAPALVLRAKVCPVVLLVPSKHIESHLQPIAIGSIFLSQRQMQLAPVHVLEKLQHWPVALSEKFAGHVDAVVRIHT